MCSSLCMEMNRHTHVDPTLRELMFSEGTAVTCKKLFTAQYKNCLKEIFIRYEGNKEGDVHE